MLDTVRNKIWARLRYQCKSTNCGNCTHSGEWADNLGKCGVLVGLAFDVIRDGICKLHSAFNGGNIKRT